MPAENSRRLFDAPRRLFDTHRALPEFNSVFMSIVTSSLLFAASFAAQELASVRAQAQSGMPSQSQSSQFQFSQSQSSQFQFSQSLALVQQALAAELNAA